MSWQEMSWLERWRKRIDRRAISWLQRRGVLPTGPTALARGIRIQGRIEVYSGGVLQDCVIELEEPIQARGIGGSITGCTISPRAGAQLSRGWIAFPEEPPSAN